MSTRLVTTILVAVGLCAGGAGASYYYKPRTLLPEPPPPLLTLRLDDSSARVELPGAGFIAQLGQTYSDELYAYLVFDYLRGSPLLKNKEVFLYFEKREGNPTYSVMHAFDNLLDGIPLAGRLVSAGFIRGFDWRFVDQATLRIYRRQTAVFVRAYNFPIRRKLESLKPGELALFLRRFLHFKSRTDIRVRKRLDPVPTALERESAERLATDILTVADFYSIPVDFFVGIGAMENNYMDVKGDLGNTIWKRRAEKGDVVLRRRRGLVLVLNESSGVWQITRETLRYAHRLYLKDTRDYSRLPEHLRPQTELDLENVPSELLTTYAALLFRHLIDRFEGDYVLATGAYNGGPGNPNAAYSAGVQSIARYARRIFEQAASLHGKAVVEMRFIQPGW